MLWIFSETQEFHLRLFLTRLTEFIEITRVLLARTAAALNIRETETESVTPCVYP